MLNQRDCRIKFNCHANKMHLILRSSISCWKGWILANEEFFARECFFFFFNILAQGLKTKLRSNKKC